MLSWSRIRARRRWLGVGLLIVLTFATTDIGWVQWRSRVAAEHDAAKLRKAVAELTATTLNTLLGERNVGSPVVSLAVLADFRLASGGEDGNIAVWPEEGTRESVILAQGSSVLSLAVLADGRLASGGKDGRIRLWPKNGMGEPLVLAQGSPVTSLAVLADERLASGGIDGRIRLWPKNGMGEPLVLSQGSSVLSLAVLRDGRLASGGIDGRIRLWPKDGMGEPVVLSQHSSVLSLAVLRDGRLASGGESGKITLSLTDQGDLIAALCDRAGPNLTRDEWTRFVGPEIPWRPCGA
jgi:WD40 repeat protein